VTFEPTAAAGPYPGTFTEQGTVEIGPQSQAPVPVGPGPLDSVLTGTQGYSAGPLTSWTARFRIESGADVVVGTKTLTARVPPNYGACVTRDNEPSPGPLPPAGFPVNGYFSIADASLAYNATIFTPAGVYRDSGTADSDLRETFARAANGSGVTSDVGLLLEIFSSDGTAPTPATKSDCKKGGWQDFGVFKNQGDCVSFFATGGKNPPAG
jgi:hypothetical protein